MVERLEDRRSGVLVAAAAVLGLVGCGVARWTAADLAGVKLRMPPGDAWQLLGRSLGANPTPMAYAEVYTGLQTGAIDGQDNPLPNVQNMKFYEVMSQIVLTSHLVGYDLLVVSAEVWNALSPEGQEAFQAAADAVTIYGSDYELRRLFQTTKCLVCMKTEIVFVVWTDVREHLNIGARAEKLFARARDHDHLNGVVHPCVENRTIELLHHLIAVRISRRIIERDDRYAIASFVIEFLHPCYPWLLFSLG